MGGLRKPTTPGELLQEYLNNWATEEFAQRMNFPFLLVEGILDSSIAINVHIARRLARALDTTPQFWLNAQIALEEWEEQEGITHPAQVRLT